MTFRDILQRDSSSGIVREASVQFVSPLSDVREVVFRAANFEANESSRANVNQPLSLHTTIELENLTR